MATKVVHELRDETMWITFVEEEERRPCTLDFDVLDQLDQTLDAVEAEKSVRVAVVRAASEKYFVVGANIEALRRLTPEGMETWIRRGHATFNRLACLPLPVIACVAGAAMGGGLELAAACDFIVAGENARFAQPEAALGFMMGWGGTYRLPKMVGAAKAKRMFYTGEVLSAAEALEWGLVTEVVPAAGLNARVETIAADIRRNDPLSIRFTKEVVNAHMYDRMALSVQFEAANSVACISSPATRKRMDDFFASRKKK